MTGTGRWTDPFDDMSDEELDAHVDALFAARPRSVGVSLRVPSGLLERLKREATRAGVPYQTFMKAMLETAVERLERRGASRSARPTGSGRRRTGRRADRRSGTAV